MWGLGCLGGGGGQNVRQQQWLLCCPRVRVGRSVSFPESAVHGERRELVSCNDCNSIAVIAWGVTLKDSEMQEEIGFSGLGIREGGVAYMKGDRGRVAGVVGVARVEE